MASDLNSKGYPNQEESFDEDEFDMDNDGFGPDEDEEYVMDDSEDEEEYSGYGLESDEEESVGDSEEVDLSALEGLSDLDKLVYLVRTYQEENNLPDPMLRQQLFEEGLRSLCQSEGVNFDDLILSFGEEDKLYSELLVALYPKLTNRVSGSTLVHNRTVLIKLLGQALAPLVETPEVEDVDRPSSESASEVESAPSDLEIQLDLPDPELDSATDRVMAVYKDLYEVGFELKVPFGILVQEGVLILDKDNRAKIWKQESLANLYKLFASLAGAKLRQGPVRSGLEASKLREVSFKDNVTYYPEFHLGNIYGILGDTKLDNWDKFAGHLRMEVRENIKRNRDAGRSLDFIVNALTTCIIISEFDHRSALKLRAYIGGMKFDARTYLHRYEAVKSAIMNGIGQPYHTQVLQSGVLEHILVFNMAAFNGRPLFAYEAVQSLLSRGRRPSLRNMILGQDTSGKILTINLDRQNACIILVGAGQRSGKGVLTLNMLGTILSEGSPLIYLDGKPDMSEVLMKVGTSHGIKPAVWDAFEPFGNVVGRGAPERIRRENPSIFGVLMYLKVLQLMMLAASYQAKGEKFLDGKRPFFIFDEVFAVQMTMADAWKDLVSTVKMKKPEGEKKREVDWYMAVGEWAEKLDASLPAVINSQLPKSGVSTVWLFQSMQPTSWNPYATPRVTSGSSFNILKNPIMSRLSIKMLGRGTTDSEYALGADAVKKHELIVSRVSAEGGRHFAMTTAQKPMDISAITVFKPYLVLNEATNGSKSVEELRSNLPPDVWNVIAPNGSLHPGAGFEGFAKMLGEEAIQNMVLGRRYLEAIMERAGLMSRYSSVEDYIYDCSIDSFHTLGSLLQGVFSEDQVSEAYDPTEEIVVGGYTPTPYLDESKDNVSTTSSSVNADQGRAKGAGSAPSQVAAEDEIAFADEFGDEFGGGEAEPGDGSWFEESQPRAPKSQGGTSPRPSRVSGGVSVQQDIDNAFKQSWASGVQDASSYKSPSQINGYAQVYREPMRIPSNPFEVWRKADSLVGSMNSIRVMSKYLMDEIARVFYHYDRIESVEITGSGLVINNVAFRPSFSPDFIESLPFDIKERVANGDVTELFHFENLYRFKNLMVLRIANAQLAEGRVRREMGIPPKKSWDVLFRKFRTLKLIDIGGVQITDEVTAKQYDDNGRGGYEFKETLRSFFKLPVNVVSDSRIQALWNSRPVRIATSAVGWTLGVKAVMVAASLFGPWGWLMGAFAGYSAYRHYFKNQNSAQSNSGNVVSMDEWTESNKRGKRNR